MGKNPQTTGRLRPVDLARRHGLSTQAVRNYEAAGILPDAGRTPHGYRTYTPLHAHALTAFLALLPGHGHATATSIMRAVNHDEPEEAFRLIDESHAQLLEDRRTLRAVEDALRDLKPGASPPAGGARGPGSGPDPRAASGSGPGSDPGPGSRPGPGPEAGGVFVGPLAAKLGIRPATLRKWERAGVVTPRRDPRTGYRVYDGADVRDAQLAHQLRRGGHRLEQIASMVARVRAAGGTEPLAADLRDWHARLAARGRALLAGAAALDAYLDERGVAGRRPDPGGRHAT
ncbi:MerR family transcriptional regulator [Streptomyces sp. V2I9]|uniref:MerR family transcriptional regulator n=1 Tax=Streptomyces sp. V2I9 TaxID=3042304 RepID=UPI002786283B|nr:MerR family transcriptional regulator [Streptomyces sp. V2I9]MDQ0988595.1 DNA-binding transcriptional MerR regulator [Streptomyces sp. V2I9]